MHFVIGIAVVFTLGAVFALTGCAFHAYKAGKAAGEKAEAKGIAEALKIGGLVQADYRSVIADVLKKETAALYHLRAFLARPFDR